jgi:hypothetical protein
VNAQVDNLITAGVLRRVLAFTETEVLELHDRSVVALPQHQWLFLHSLDSITTVRRLVEFYVQEHNRRWPSPI